MIANYLVILAGILWALELYPQIYKTWKTKQVKDISLFFISLCSVAYVLFISGCILMKSWALVFSHLLPFINVCVLFVLILKYRGRK